MATLLGTDGAALGPENLLAYADGNTATELRDRLDLALRYLSNWYQAVKGSSDEAIWDQKLDSAKALVTTADQLMDPALVFPGVKEIAAYNDAGAAYTTVFQQLQLSADSLPQPGLLTELPDALTTILQTPSYLVGAAANAAGDVLGSTARNLLYQLWPVLAIGAVGLGLYLFWPGVRVAAAKVGT